MRRMPRASLIQRGDDAQTWHKIGLQTPDCFERRMPSFTLFLVNVPFRAVSPQTPEDNHPTSTSCLQYDITKTAAQRWPTKVTNEFSSTALNLRFAQRRCPGPISLLITHSTPGCAPDFLSPRNLKSQDQINTRIRHPPIADQIRGRHSGQFQWMSG